MEVNEIKEGHLTKPGMYRAEFTEFSVLGVIQKYWAMERIRDCYGLDLKDLQRFIS